MTKNVPKHKKVPTRRVRRPKRAPEPPVRGFHHAATLVSDLARAEAFYSDVLGLQVNKRWFEDDGSPRSVWLDSGRGSFIALEKATPGFEATAGAFHEGPPGWFVLALAIRRSSRSAWEDRLRAAGVKIQRRTPYTLFFRDPDGNRIGLSHYPDAAPLTGG